MKFTGTDARASNIYGIYANSSNIYGAGSISVTMDVKNTGSNANRICCMSGNPKELKGSGSIYLNNLQDGTTYHFAYDGFSRDTETHAAVGYIDSRNYEKTAGVYNRDVAMLDFVIDNTEFVYNGEEQKPSVTLAGLKEGTDYTLEYSADCVNAGKKTVTVTGTGKFKGTFTKEFEIKKIDISEKTAKLSYTSCTYSGKAKKPSVTIEGLTKGTDFTVSYSNNTNAGKAKAVIKGIGNYEGEIVKSFTIKKATPTVKITSSAKTVKYTDVKKKSTYTSVIAVSGAKGTKTFRKVSGSSKLSVTTSGKIKVVKGTRKGKYKIKVKVTSGSTSNYYSKTSPTKEITVTVK